MVLCGLSAGSLCWFEGGVTDSFGPLRDLRDGLGLLPGSHCPALQLGVGAALDLPAAGRRAGSRAGSRPTTAWGCASPGAELAEVVSARADARAYRVDPNRSGADETAAGAAPLAA